MSPISQYKLMSPLHVQWPSTDRKSWQNTWQNSSVTTLKHIWSKLNAKSTAMMGKPSEVRSLKAN